jgi:hypothetical protein
MVEMNRETSKEDNHPRVKEYKELLSPDNQNEHLITTVEEAKEYGAEMAKESISKIKLTLHYKDIG